MKIATVRTLPKVLHKRTSKYLPFIRAAKKARGKYVVTTAPHTSAIHSLAKRHGLSVAMRAGTVYVFKPRRIVRRRSK